MLLTPARLRSFLTKVEKPAGIDGCWIWRGARQKDGYASGPGTNSAPLYRTAYEWMVGPIPDGCQLDHLCRNRACVNPHHLEPVSPSENLRRAREPQPWAPRRYCRNGHALVGDNARVWSRGKGIYETRCYACHNEAKALHVS